MMRRTLTVLRFPPVGDASQSARNPDKKFPVNDAKRGSDAIAAADPTGNLSCVTKYCCNAEESIALHGSANGMTIWPVVSWVSAHLW